MDEILDILRVLRAPGGCPWDRDQTFETLRPFLLEEACEALDAIGSGADAAIVDELGDVLLIVAFYAVIAEEQGRWTLSDATASLAQKLRRRHPHVFGDLTARDAAEVVEIWKRVKMNERGSSSGRPTADEPPTSLPALARAAAWHRSVARTEQTRPSEETDRDLSAADVWGDRLYELATQVADEGLDPELVLRDAVARRIAGGVTE